MTPIYVVQNELNGRYDETHSSLDIRWFTFLAQIGFYPILLPNHLGQASILLAENLAQCALLTGGGLHQTKGRDEDPRSSVEQAVLEWSTALQHPVIGVCRGMQTLLQHSGGHLTPCTGQVTDNQTIVFQECAINVNSYHNYTCTVPDCFSVIGEHASGVVKAVVAKHRKWLGIMWHPERNQQLSELDSTLFQQFLLNGQLCKP